MFANLIIGIDRSRIVKGRHSLEEGIEVIKIMQGEINPATTQPSPRIFPFKELLLQAQKKILLSTIIVIHKA